MLSRMQRRVEGGGAALVLGCRDGCGGGGGDGGPVGCWRLQEEATAEGNEDEACSAAHRPWKERAVGFRKGENPEYVARQGCDRKLKN